MADPAELLNAVRAENPVEPALPPDAPVADDLPWPRAGAAYFALAVIVFATFLNFFDSAAFGLLIEQIRRDFHLTNLDIGWLQGPANVIFYLVVLLPLSRLVDVYPRKYVLAAGILLIALLNACGGMTMTFTALFATRMLVGAGGSAHAPGAYSMLSDFFSPSRRAKPFAILQLGFILGGTLGLVIAGRLLALAVTLPVTHLGGIEIHGWKYVLIMLAVPGVVAAGLMLLVPEPPRRGAMGHGGALPFRVVVAEIWRRRAIYGPLFIALGFSTAAVQGTMAWATPFYMRTYGWSETQIALRVPPFMLAAQLAGLFLGPALVRWYGRRDRAANVKAVTLCFAVFAPLAIVGPLMPNGWLALGASALGGMMGLASAVPQNLVIQEITPNEMRGQVTGLYLMMFTAVGAMGPLIVGLLIDDVFGHDGDVWKALALMAVLLVPAAAFTISRAIAPYRAEVARLAAH